MKKNQMEVNYKITIEIDFETGEPKVLEFRDFEEAEEKFRECRNIYDCKIVLHDAHNLSKIYATYYP